MCKVLNKHHAGVPAGAIYIGRGSKWGNLRCCGLRVSCLRNCHRRRTHIMTWDLREWCVNQTEGCAGLVTPVELRPACVTSPARLPAADKATLTKQALPQPAFPGKRRLFRLLGSTGSS